MQAQGIPRRGGAAFNWTWDTIAGVVLGMIQILITYQLADRFGTFQWIETGNLSGLFGAGTLGGLLAGATAELMGHSRLCLTLAGTGCLSSDGQRYSRGVNP